MTTTKEFRVGGIIGLILGLLIASGVVVGPILIQIHGTQLFQKESIDLDNFIISIVGLAALVFSIFSLSKKYEKLLRKGISDFWLGFIIYAAGGSSGGVVIFSVIIPLILR